MSESNRHTDIGGEQGQVIHVHFDGFVRMERDNVWPDRDGPAVLTAQAVKQVMEASGSKTNVLSEWNLLPDLEVLVEVDGVYVRPWGPS